jgi:hypothetical protein
MKLRINSASTRFVPGICKFAEKGRKIVTEQIKVTKSGEDESSKGTKKRADENTK